MSSPLVDALHQWGQVLTYLGVLGASGLVLFGSLVLAPAAAPVRAGVARLAAALAGVALLGLLLLLSAGGAWVAGTGASGLVDLDLLWQSLTSRAGLATAVAAAGLILALGPGHGRAGRLAVCGGAILALLSLPVTGHTRSAEPTWLVVGSDVVHVLAGSIWFGGVLGLLLTLRAPVPTPAAAATVARFSSIAAWLVLVLAGSGILLAWRILPGAAALTTPGYGLTLVVKVTTVTCIVGIAAWNRARLVPRVTRTGTDADDGRERLQRTVAVEAGLLAVVLAVTGLLVSQSPSGHAVLDHAASLIGRA